MNVRCEGTIVLYHRNSIRGDTVGVFHYEIDKTEETVVEWLTHFIFFDIIISEYQNNEAVTVLTALKSKSNQTAWYVWTVLTRLPNKNNRSDIHHHYFGMSL